MMKKKKDKMRMMSIKELMDMKVININDVMNPKYQNQTDDELPIQRLINNHSDVLLNEEGKVVVKVGSSDNIIEDFVKNSNLEIFEFSLLVFD